MAIVEAMANKDKLEKLMLDCNQFGLYSVFHILKLFGNVDTNRNYPMLHLLSIVLARPLGEEGREVLVARVEELGKGDALDTLEDDEEPDSEEEEEEEAEEDEEETEDEEEDDDVEEIQLVNQEAVSPLKRDVAAAIIPIKVPSSSLFSIQLLHSILSFTPFTFLDPPPHAPLPRCTTEEFVSASTAARLLGLGGSAPAQLVSHAHARAANDAHSHVNACLRLCMTVAALHTSGAPTTRSVGISQGVPLLNKNFTFVSTCPIIHKSKWSFQLLISRFGHLLSSCSLTNAKRR